MKTKMQFVLNAALGALTVCAFAPMRWWWLPFVALALLFARMLRAPNVRAAFGTGFAFGLGFFGFGVWWLFIALNTFGQMHPALAALATALVVTYMAVFPALAGALAHWLRPVIGSAVYVALPAAFAGAEWLRGTLFTGFPWLMFGASQAGESPLAGYAPLIGGYGISLLVAGVGALIAWAFLEKKSWRIIQICAAGILIAATLAIGHGLQRVEWSAASQQPVKISLVQGNVAQEAKFRREDLARNFARYQALIAKAQGDIVILPETTIVTLIESDADPALRTLAQPLTAQRRALIVGAPLRERDQIFNAALAVTSDRVQFYRKMHLVPFGEYMPLQQWFGWFYDNVAIPLSSFTAGDAAQAAIKVGTETLGMSICYEDAFASAVRPQAAQATVLTNITNDAWYGRSWAAEQHAQIAQLRAAEFARPLLRATNTGMTTHIDHLGIERARLPWFSEGILEVSVQGRTGPTPYLTFGELPLLLVILAILGIAIARRFSATR